jgi:hypothetical protein
VCQVLSGAGGGCHKITKMDKNHKNRSATYNRRGLFARSEIGIASEILSISDYEDSLATARGTDCFAFSPASHS